MVQRLRNLRPWLLGALAWTFLSLTVILDYAEQGEPEHLVPLWFVLSLLWWQFCFAGIFSALRHSQHRRLPGLLAISLIPPALLHLLILIIT